MSDIEKEIQEKGLVAQRVTPQDIEDSIDREYYFTAEQAVAGVVDEAMVNRFLSWPVPEDVYPDGVPGKPGRHGTNLLTYEQAKQMLNHVLAPSEVPQPLKLLTFCVLVLKNGYTVIGESACVSPENFDAEVGRKVARENAVNKIWPLLGYVLKNKLYSEAK